MFTQKNTILSCDLSLITSVLVGSQAFYFFEKSIFIFINNPIDSLPKIVYNEVEYVNLSRKTNSVDCLTKKVTIFDALEKKKHLFVNLIIVDTHTHAHCACTMYKYRKSVDHINM